MVIAESYLHHSHENGVKIVGNIEVEENEPTVRISFDKLKMEHTLINHPILGEVPHYKAVIYDSCQRASKILTEFMEK